MAREFAKAFYHSAKWKRCRNQYILNMPIEKRGLCEICYANGIQTLGKELHHKIHLTPSNIKDYNIAYNHDNLILLCFDCHQREHNKRNDLCYKYDDFGNLVPK